MSKLTWILGRIVFPALMGLTSGLVSAQSLLIVELRAGFSPIVIANQTSTQYLEVASGSPFYLFRTKNNEDPDFAQLRLMANAGVVFAEDNVLVGSPEHSGGGKGSSVAVVGDRTHLLQTNAGYLGRLGFSDARASAVGRSVRLGIVDTGLAPAATTLWARVVASANFVEKNTPAYDVTAGKDTNLNGRFDEGAGHGTFVAGLANLIAPQARLVISRSADSDGVASAWTIIRGIVYSAVSGCEVANVSLGSPDRIPALDRVLEWAETKGMLIVAPAGNRNLKELLYPSRFGTVAAIAGVDINDRKATFSNYEGKVLACATAVGFKSTWLNGMQGTWSGTSFASPLVAGAVADCLKRRPRAFPADLRLALGTAGMDVDGVNPNYKKQLGRRLELRLLDDRIRVLPTR